MAVEVDAQRRFLPAGAWGDGMSCRAIISIYIEDATRLHTWVSAVGVSGSAEGFGESCQAKRSCDLASRYSSSVSHVSTQTSRFTCRSGCCESLGYHSNMINTMLWEEKEAYHVEFLPSLLD